MSDRRVPTLGILLEKMKDADPDFRIVATDDLTKAINDGSIRLNEQEEVKVVEVVLELLDDTNGETQNRAVHCMAALAPKLGEQRIKMTLNELCANMEIKAKEKEQLRDVSIMALKSIIKDLSGYSTEVNTEIATTLVGRFVVTITEAKSGDDTIRLEALGVLADVLGMYGGLVTPLHESTLTCLLTQLTYTRSAVRKRAITAVSKLVGVIDDAKFSVLIKNLLDGLKTASRVKDAEIAKAYNQCFSIIQREAGPRVGTFLSDIFPCVASQMNEDHDELRESALQCIDAMATRHGADFQPFLKQSTDFALLYIKYDPNMDDEDGVDEGDSMETDDSEVEESDDEDDNEYWDDDDMSWKVRRSSARLLGTIVRTRPALLSTHYETIAPILIKRLVKEREQTVKLELFAAFEIFLRLTRVDRSDQIAVSSMNEDTTEHSSIELLAQLTPLTVKNIRSEMKTSKKDARSKQACFHLLTEMARVRPGFLDAYLDVLVPVINEGLESVRGHSGLQTNASGGGSDVTSGLKIDVLEFMYCLLTTEAPEVIQPYAALLVAPVCVCISDDFYKTVAMATRVATVLIRCLRPIDKDYPSGSNAFDFTPYVDPLFQAIGARFEAVDVDQEVKERSSVCIATLISHMGDALGKEKIANTLPTFLARLQNETVRVITVKALTMIASSPLHIDISDITTACVVQLSLFLRKESRQLRLASMLCLSAMQANLHFDKENQGVEDAIGHVLSECPRVIVDNDLQLTEVVLTFITSVLKDRQHLTPTMLTRMRTCGEDESVVASEEDLHEHGSVLGAVVQLLSSPLLQGAALDSALALIELLVTVPECGLQFDVFYNRLCEIVLSDGNTPAPSQGDVVSLHMSKQSFASTSKALAVLVVFSADKVNPTVVRLLSQIESTSESCNAKLLALLTLGEIGCRVDLFSYSGIEKALESAFSHTCEDIKLGAAHALGVYLFVILCNMWLGLMCIGNRNDFMEYLIDEIVKKPKRQYLLLNSLKEIIQYESLKPVRVADFKAYVPRLWSLLFEQCTLCEEGMRGVASDCLGKLTIIDPELCLPMLIERLKSEDASVRCTVITAVKFTITDTPKPIDSLLRPLMRTFLSHIEDQDLHVRRVSLVTLNSAAHNKASLISDQLDTLLPLLYTETVIKPELIRTVKMGPFTHKFDDGLDIRKAAFECMYTLLDWCVTKTDMQPFIAQVATGLSDHYDIKILGHLMLVRLCALTPSTVLQQMDNIVAPLLKTVQTKVKAEAVKQEIEKNDELIRSALRAIYALSKIHDAETSSSLEALIAFATTRHKDKYSSIVREQETRHTTHDPMDIS
eukprot:CFRG3789T1